MASDEPPLQIDWIGAGPLRDRLPGRLGLTSLPGKRGASIRYPGRVYRRELDADLAALTGADVRHLILLVEDHELMRWGDLDIVARAAHHRLRISRWPIRDGGVPTSHREMDAILEAVRHARATGNVAIACMGGVGRTGTAAACALVAAGWDADAAIGEVRRIRHPTAVETAEQVAFVRQRAARR